ncbi:hypothetical protein R3O67_29775 [Bacillus cereus]|uniref:hypothetical protein n=1 Tax=Bacillus cereus TaxID=1396 RepID=UPI00307AD02D
MKDYQRENKKTFIYRLIEILEHLKNLSVNENLIRRFESLENSVVDYNDLDFPISSYQRNIILSVNDEAIILETLEQIEQSILKKNTIYIQSYSSFSAVHLQRFLSQFQLLNLYLESYKTISEDDDSSLKLIPTELTTNIDILKKSIDMFYEHTKSRD